ncbi:hypothetical protein FACS1894196_4650 [Clostridia bacterium]|nr:hypothetical protein FACS1894196_4650 [Clostridia bacterium]
MKKRYLAILSLLLALMLAGGALADIGAAGAPVPVTMLLKDMSSTDEAGLAYCEAVERALAEQGIYVHLSFIDAPAGTYIEVVPLAVMNEVLTADILYFQGNTDAQVAAQGFLEDMRPYVEGSTYLKDVMYQHNKDRLENNPALLAATPLDVFTPVIRQDWVAQLDTYEALLAEATVDNYYAFFKELQDKGLCEYAVCVYGDHTRLDSVFDAAFGITTTLVKNADGRWIYKQVTPEMKELLGFYAKLYAEGLIDPEYLTNTWDVAEEKFYSGKAAMLIGKAGGTVDVYDRQMQTVNGAGAALTALPPAKGEAGQYYIAVDVAKEERGRVIATDSKVKDAAFAVMDFAASPAGRVLDLYGVEGFHYDLVDGKITPKADAPAWYGVFYGSLKGVDPDLKADAPLGFAGLQSLSLAEAYYVADNKVNLPAEYAAYWDAMNALFKEYASDIIRGQRPIDDFDEFVQKWNAAGGDTVGEYLATVME